MKKILILVLILVVFAGFNCGEASAMNTGFSTQPLSDEEMTSFVSNIDFSSISVEPEKRPIRCFDVNSGEMIAIGTQSGTAKTVCVYSHDGEFKYGFSFNCDGNFCVEWAGDNINVFFVRSGVVAAVDSKGTVLDVLKVQNTVEDNSYLNNYIYSTQRTHGETTYSIKNDLGLFNLLMSSYSELTAANTDGEEAVLYSVNSAQVTKIIIICSLTAAALVLAIVKMKRKNGVRESRKRITT